MSEVGRLQQGDVRVVDPQAWRTAILVTVVAALVRLFFAWWIPLFPDEAYYWDWSRHLAGGYFDHPPMIALLIRGGTLLGGATRLGVRVFPVVAGTVASFAAVGIARRIDGDPAARSASIVFALMPLAASGLVLATPDAPLLATIAVTLYFVVRALQSPIRSQASLLWWCAAGVALGLAFASKYTSILLPIGLLVAVLLRPSLRARLGEPGPYVACVLATLVFLPVLHWNATHDWISFRFQIQHGLGTPRGSALQRELELFGGQLGLVSPILFVLAATAVWRAVRRPVSDAHFALAMVALASWGFFVYSALRRPVEANWPAPSYVPAVALLAAMASSLTWDRWLRRGIVLAAVLVAIIYVHALVPILPLPARRDPLARGAGWDGAARQVNAARAARTAGPGRTFVGADRYQDVSELAFHLPDHPDAYCVCLTGRHNQYELWPGFADVARPGDALVLLLDERQEGVVHETAALLAPYFASVTRGAPAPLLRGGDTVTVRRVWTLAGYRGGWPRRPSP
ncbi:MAG TPA: glycosyltransferase family 39 protein [Gemmatimonadaceae bacterium]|nr:glycosyltransferase family 39 protein [Gemmatimonadaceae bacterium]